MIYVQRRVILHTKVPIVDFNCKTQDRLTSKNLVQVAYSGSQEHLIYTGRHC